MEQALDLLFNGSYSSDNSTDEDIKMFLTDSNPIVMRKPRVINFIENVVYAYDNDEFKKHFRMGRVTFYFLLNMIEPYVKDMVSKGPLISTETQLYITLYVLGTPDSYRSIVTKFNVGNATAWRAVKRVVKALCILRNTFIRWPTEEEAEATANTIVGKYKFPDVLGIVDGTHIRINAPKENSTAYINRKGYHSIQLQVICNEKREFIHCYAGMPGCVHDMRVFKYSGVQQKCSEDYFGNKHLLGDSAYVLQKQVMIPYKDNGHLSLGERNYNYILSRSRIIIERAIELLKGRWRFILDKLPMRKTNLIPYYVMACTVLHNICLMRGDEDIEYPITILNEVDNEGPLEITPEQLHDGNIKREEIKNNLMIIRRH
ncbi:putative nuclease HARBI1 [Prorops nasuta]|uniref:putative nuclease HARBI1 n=1 Tax=Prorops nasuta TaxID=863751 RepID=UPI0034CFAAC5